MKKIFLLILMTFSMQGISKDKNKNIELYGDNNYPPYSYVGEDNKLVGIYPSILREAVKEITGYKVTLKAVPWKRGLRMLKKNKIQGLFPPYFRVEQRPFMWPYSLAILEEEAVVVCRKEVKLGKKPFWPNDFKNLKIARNLGFATGGNVWKQLIETQEIKDHQVRDIEMAILMMSKDRIDCYMNDRISIFWTINKMIKDKKIDKHKIDKFVEKAVISRERGFIGYSSKWNPSFKEDFLKKLDHSIHEMRKKGRVEEIKKKFLSQ